MDADTLRLILLIIGVVLVLALYLWERSRDPDDDYDSDEYEDDFDEFDELEDDDEPLPADRGSNKREPNLGRLPEDEDEEEMPAAEPVPPPVTPHAPEPPRVGAAAAARAPRPTTRPVADPDADLLLIQISVAATRGPFSGTGVMDAAEGCGLEPGEMEIFHFYPAEDNEDQNPYFSMANMVKPGSFPFDEMDSFSTPGLMLFAQLEGEPEDMAILDEMIATARKLANILGGDVLDETRRPLTVRKEEQLRNLVLKHELKWSRTVLH